MPHCVIEYSKPVGQQVETTFLLKAVYEGSLNSQLFKPEDIKCRATAYEDYLQTGDVKDFIHATVYILDGRSQEQKKGLSESILGTLQELGVKSCVLTVDIRDIETACYGKVTEQP